MGERFWIDKHIFLNILSFFFNKWTYQLDWNCSILMRVTSIVQYILTDEVNLFDKDILYWWAWPHEKQIIILRRVTSSVLDKVGFRHMQLLPPYSIWGLTLILGGIKKPKKGKIKLWVLRTPPRVITRIQNPGWQRVKE